ncbi:MAG: SRPBCC domain-containing protein [Gammaproteobacteria bacterium]|nr:SRPBCC domain-containing protein [Gammaproteobacteria bacterium]
MAKIELRGIYAFSRADVWAALTTREALSEWLMHTDFDLKIGHKFKFHGKPEGGWRGFMECTVLEYTEEEYLKIDWLGMPEHDLQTVEFFLNDHPRGCELRLVHSGWNRSHGPFNGFVLRKIITFGWKKMLNKQLAPVLEEGVSCGFANIPANLVNKWRKESDA